MSCPACMPRMAGKMCSNVLVTTVLQKVRHRLLCRGRIAADLVEDNHCFQTGLSILGDLSFPPFSNHGAQKISKTFWACYGSFFHGFLRR